MGHSCGICAISGIPIMSGNRTVLIPIRKIQNKFAPDGPILRGTYDDYGCIEDIKTIEAENALNCFEGLSDDHVLGFDTVYEELENFSNMVSDRNISNDSEFHLVNADVYDLVLSIGRKYKFEYYGKFKVKNYETTLNYSAVVDKVVDYIWGRREHFMNAIVDHLTPQKPDKELDLSKYTELFERISVTDRQDIINTLTVAHARGKKKEITIDMLFGESLSDNIGNVSAYSLINRMLTPENNGVPYGVSYISYISSYAAKERYFIHYYLYLLLEAGREELHKFIKHYAELGDLNNGLIVINRNNNRMLNKYNMTQDPNMGHLRAMTRYHNGVAKILKTLMAERNNASNKNRNI